MQSENIKKRVIDKNNVEKEYTYYNNLLERKETVIRLIDEKGLLTEDLKENILNRKRLQKKNR